jgi:hypothetical protein
LHSTSASILLSGLHAVFMLLEPPFQSCNFPSFSFWLSCRMHITNTKLKAPSVVQTSF